MSNIKSKAQIQKLLARGLYSIVKLLAKEIDNIRQLEDLYAVTSLIQDFSGQLAGHDMIKLARKLITIVCKQKILHDFMKIKYARFDESFDIMEYLKFAIDRYHFMAIALAIYLNKSSTTDHYEDSSSMVCSDYFGESEEIACRDAVFRIYNVDGKHIFQSIEIYQLCHNLLTSQIVSRLKTSQMDILEEKFVYDDQSNDLYLLTLATCYADPVSTLASVLEIKCPENPLSSVVPDTICIEFQKLYFKTSLLYQHTYVKIFRANVKLLINLVSRDFLASYDLAETDANQEFWTWLFKHESFLEIVEKQLTKLDFWNNILTEHMEMDDADFVLLHSISKVPNYIAPKIEPNIQDVDYLSILMNRWSSYL